MRGWILDEKAAAKGLPALPTAAALERPFDRTELWRRAARRGPRLAPLLLERRLDARGAPGLSILAALGLAGGPGASRALTQILESSRSTEARVIAALGAGRPNVRIAPRTLRKLATDSKREVVLQFAARIGLLCQGYGAALEQDLAGFRESPTRARFWRALLRAFDAAAPARVTELPSIGAAGSYDELTTRAVLLDAIRHPGVLDASALESLLARSDRPVLRRLASLALGRIGVSVERSELEDLKGWFDGALGLDRSSFFAGLSTLPDELAAAVRRGPGRARNDARQMRFRAAAARLVPARLLNETLRGLLDLDPAQSAPALAAILRRVLVENVVLDLDDAVRTRLRGLPSRAGLLLSVVGAGGGLTLSGEDAKRLGVRLTTAVRLLRTQQLGEEVSDGRRVLWRLFVREERLPSADGPGSPMHVFLEECAALIRDLFVAGARTGARDGVFVPDGIRLARKDYYAVLDAWLGDWPLPGRVPSRR